MSAPGPSKWASMTPLLAFSCFCLLVGDMLFGYDTGSFGGILGNPGFVNQFGQADAKGIYRIAPLRTSLLSSLAFIGKFIGCAVASPLIEALGHRKVFVILSAVSIIGIIIEITAAGSGYATGRVAQFIVGRIVVYISVGLVEVCVITYQSEIVPAVWRGFVVSSLQLFLNAGGLVASGVNKGFSKHTDSVGWRVITGIQFLFPLLIIAFVPFLPDSPRWLLSKDRDTDALDALRRLRTKDEVATGACDDELATIKQALSSGIHKGPWSDLFRGTNARRTFLVIAYYIFQQITGQSFVSTYQVVFYKGNGYADMAFTYPLITSCLTVLAVLPCMFFVDHSGRRPVLMTSYALQGFWLFVLAGLGGKEYKNQAERNTCVAAFIFFALSFNLGGASVPYLLGAELPAHALREKTSAIGTTINVVFAFGTNFMMPYMLDAMAFKVGWIWGSMAVLAFVFTAVALPETKNLSLEEIDGLFVHRGWIVRRGERGRVRSAREGSAGVEDVEHKGGVTQEQDKGVATVA